MRGAGREPTVRFPRFAGLAPPELRYAGGRREHFHQPVSLF